MHPLFAEKLRSARRLNGFSRKDLADKLENKISPHVLRRLERGEVLPDSEMMKHLCNALHVLPDYFSRETVIELSGPVFHKVF